METEINTKIANHSHSWTGIVIEKEKEMDALMEYYSGDAAAVKDYEDKIIKGQNSTSDFFKLPFMLYGAFLYLKIEGLLTGE